MIKSGKLRGRYDVEKLKLLKRKEYKLSLLNRFEILAPSVEKDERDLKRKGTSKHAW